MPSRVPAYHDMLRPWYDTSPTFDPTLTGVELEAEAPTQDEAERVAELCNRTGIIIAERDGSLHPTRGVEFVGPPIPWDDYYFNPKTANREPVTPGEKAVVAWRRLLATLRKNGWRAWDTDTRNRHNHRTRYGLHINLNAIAIGAVIGHTTLHSHAEAGLRNPDGTRNLSTTRLSATVPCPQILPLLKMQYVLHRLAASAAHVAGRTSARWALNVPYKPARPISPFLNDEGVPNWDRYDDYEYAVQRSYSRSFPQRWTCDCANGSHKYHALALYADTCLMHPTSCDRDIEYIKRAEFRLYRATLSYYGLLRCIEHAHSIREFSATIPTHQIKSFPIPSYHHFVRTSTYALSTRTDETTLRYPNLIEALKRRRKPFLDDDGIESLTPTMEPSTPTATTTTAVRSESLANRLATRAREDRNFSRGTRAPFTPNTQPRPTTTPVFINQPIPSDPNNAEAITLTEGDRRLLNDLAAATVISTPVTPTIPDPSPANEATVVANCWDRYMSAERAARARESAAHTTASDITPESITRSNPIDF